MSSLLKSAIVWKSPAIRWLAFAMAVAAHFPHAAAQTSALWGNAGELWSPAGRLPDFSRAGYRSSAAPIPNVPEVARLKQTDKPNGTDDISGVLQNLINTVPTPGAIVIPAGRWYINKRVYLNRSGIVLRGEDGAELYEPESLSQIDGVDPATTQLYSNAPGFIVASGGTPTSQVATVTANASKGDSQLTISPGSGLIAGDWVEITQTDPADKSLVIHMHGELNEMGATSYSQSSIYPQAFQWYVKVKSLSGNVLALEMALPLKLQTNWSPKVRKLTLNGFLTEVGIENLTIRAKGEIKKPHLHEAGWNGIQFSGVRNGWVQNVTFIDTDSGVLLSNKASFCTISGVITKGDFRTAANHPGGEIGHHAIWSTGAASFNLIKDFDIQVPFHHDLSCEGLAHHNVYMNGTGARLNFDQHRNAPWANLYTDLDVGNGSRLWDSSGAVGRGPHTARELTVWGIRKSAGSFPTVPSADVITTGAGGGLGWAYLNVVGVAGLNSPQAGRGDQWVELGGASGVVPANLFTAQLAARLPNTPPTISAIADQTVTAPASAGPLTFAVSDAETQAAAIAVTASSSDQVLVPDGNIAIASAWTSADLGNPAPPGSASLGDVITLRAAGADIWGTADAGHFLSQPAAGDGEFVCRVLSLENTNPWAKSGVMLRQDASAGSANCYMLVSAANGVSFSRRLAAGGTSASTTISGISAPCWLRLVKSGTSVTGWYAADAAGARGPWQQVGAAVSIPALSGGFLAGAAATSHASGTISTSTLDNLTGSGNRLVTVTPAAGRSGTATISLTAGDGALTSFTSFEITVLPIPALGVWTGGGVPGDWSDAENWGGTTPDFDGSLAVVFQAGAADLTTHLRADRTIGSLVFAGDLTEPATIRLANRAGNSSAAAAASLTFAGPDPRIVIQPGTAAAHVLGVAAGNVILAGTFTVDHGGSGDFLIDRAITGPGGLVKTGPGTLVLAPGIGGIGPNENTFSGDTSVLGGRLVVDGKSIADSAALAISGGIVQVSGTEIVAALTIGGVPQIPGTYGSSASAAWFQDDAHFAGNGVIEIPNTPPVISAVANVSAGVGTSPWAANFTVADAEIPAAALTVTAISSNPSLLPSESIALSGTGADRVISLDPLPGRLGSATVTLTVSDGSLTATTAFTLTITGTPQEIWSFAHFGTAFAPDGADPDGDFLDNAREYILGTDPLAADSAPPLVASLDGGEIVLTFTATEAAGPGYDGLIRIFEIQSAADAASWTGLPGFTDIIAAGQTVTANITPAGGSRFYRLAVRLVPE